MLRAAVQSVSKLEGSDIGAAVIFYADPGFFANGVGTEICFVVARRNNGNQSGIGGIVIRTVVNYLTFYNVRCLRIRVAVRLKIYVQVKVAAWRNAVYRVEIGIHQFARAPIGSVVNPGTCLRI